MKNVLAKILSTPENLQHRFNIKKKKYLHGERCYYYTDFGVEFSTGIFNTVH